MTQKSLAQFFPDIQQADNDRDRLQVADLVLAFVETELRALESNDDDLTYLVEVLRCGVRRAMDDDESSAARHMLVAGSSGRPH
ncbi:hypothetical protein [Maricaulis salignorans]|uniref:Uncharacterized protein n=1 Tax=Maricaulis salignorans TaxID=144026 RepID=A0A1G9R217_9PROT|nr:hypothetical protein [Maricaulis salignorans]SDM17288.1 hypothetical protein SAMN04488568_10632 [Maricaulis salignorans]